jgi:hypothetical protein
MPEAEADAKWLYSARFGLAFSMMAWGETSVAGVIKGPGVIAICEVALLSNAEISDALEPSAPILLDCTARLGAVDTLGGGVTDGELVTLEEMR